MHCATCKSLINDYWDIALPDDTQPVRCGDCALPLRCMSCKGPLRHVSTDKRGSQVYHCMECEKRYQVKLRKVRKPV